MTRQNLIRTHYSGIWNLIGKRSAFNRGRTDQLPSDFCVLEFPPHHHRPEWTYATCCMSQPGDDVPIELHMISPRQTEDIAEILYAVAHYHRTGARVGLNHTLNFGKPWLDNSQCDHGYISLPYLDGPRLELGPDGINFYWLIPVTNAEVEYTVSQGAEVLEQAFEREPFNYLDPHRKSVV